MGRLVWNAIAVASVLNVALQMRATLYIPRHPSAWEATTAVHVVLLALLAPPLLGVGARDVLPRLLLVVGPLASLVPALPLPLPQGVQGLGSPSAVLLGGAWAGTVLGACLSVPQLGAPGRGPLVGRARHWDVTYAGDWPELPVGRIRLHLGGEITLATRKRALTIDPRRITQLVWAPQEKAWAVGWIQKDVNSGWQYPVLFLVPTEAEARQIYRGINRIVYRATAADWEEWRRLVVTLPLSERARSAGGIHGVPIRRQVACPRCAPLPVGLSLCPHCRGQRATVEEDIVNVPVAAGTEPGAALVVPHAGNRDANGVCGPLIVVIGADLGPQRNLRRVY